MTKNISSIDDWLMQHGGRSQKDVLLDEKGESFVWMFNPYLDQLHERVYIPKHLK